MFGVVIRFSDYVSLFNHSINGMVNCIKITFFMNMKSSKEIILSDLSPISDFFYVKELTMKSILIILSKLFGKYIKGMHKLY